MKYKNKILSLIIIVCIFCFGLSVVKAKEPESKISIDVPAVNSSMTGDSLFVGGWVMSEVKDAKVRVQVDSDDPVIVTDRFVRDDVLNSEKGYGGRSTNSKPGFNANVSVVGYGAHTLKVEVLDDGDRVIKTETRQFTKRKPNATISIDTPGNNSSMTGDSLFVGGWVMSEDANSTIRVQVDNDKAVDVTDRVERDDVLNAISGYGGRSTNSKPGFNANVGVVNYGSHTLKVEVLDSKGEVIKAETRKFTKKAPDTMLSIDTPGNNSSMTGDSLFVGGWVMSDASNVEVRAQIDGNEAVVSTDRFVRDDVLNSVSGYGGRSTNSKPGFNINLDVVEYGSHTLKVEVLDSKGEVIKTETRKFTKKAPDTMLSIDTPGNNSSMTGDSLFVGGWVMSDASNVEVRAQIDENEAVVSKDRFVRDDVLNSVKGYGGRSNNPKPGFNINIDVVDYGSHTLKVEVLDSKGDVIKTETRKFTKKKPNTKINVDVPSVNSKVKKNVDFLGWVLCEDKNTSVVVKVNGEELKTLDRWYRDDVYGEAPSYGGRSNNPEAGIRGTVDLSKFEDGPLTLTVVVKDQKGVEVAHKDIKVNLEKYTTSVDVTSPKENSNVKGNMNIKGSVTTDAPNPTVEIKFNGNVIKSESSSLTFDENFNLDNTEDGLRSIYIIVKSAGKEIYTKEVKVNVKKEYKGRANLDAINFVNDKTVRIAGDGKLAISGWALSNDSQTDLSKEIKVYIDEQLKAEVKETDRFADDIVKNSDDNYKNYPNTKPRFNAVGIEGVGVGTHTGSIRVYNHLGEEIGRENFKFTLYSNYSLGIDVSEHNGNIGDAGWNSAKTSGINFAMIRAGVRGWDPAYGGWDNIKDDLYVKQNIANAYKAGLKVGLYFFSQATTREEGEIEAQKVINVLNTSYNSYTGKFYRDMIDTSIPIAIDVEWGDTSPNHQGRADVISNSQRNEAVKGFIDKIKSYGYKAMIYASRSWLQDNINTGGPYLDLNYIKPDDIWVADWKLNDYHINEVNINPKTWTTYRGSYSFWQHGVGGRGNIPHIDNIGGGDFDGNGVSDIDLDVRVG